MTVHYTGFYVVGEETYTGDNMSKLVLSLVNDANHALHNWEQIRMDGDGAVYAHIGKPEIYFDEDADVWAWNNGPKKYALLTKVSPEFFAYDAFGIIRTDAPETQRGNNMTNYKIVGNEYTSPDFDADEFAREMITKCKAEKFPWVEMRMDENGGFYAYSTPATPQRAQWAHEGFTGDSRHLITLDGDEVSWQDFGIIRTGTLETQDAPERTIADIVTFTDGSQDAFKAGWAMAIATMEEAREQIPYDNDEPLAFVQGYMVAHNALVQKGTIKLQ